MWGIWLKPGIISSVQAQTCICEPQGRLRGEKPACSPPSPLQWPHFRARTAVLTAVPSTGNQACRSQVMQVDGPDGIRGSARALDQRRRTRSRAASPGASRGSAPPPPPAPPATARTSAGLSDALAASRPRSKLPPGGAAAAAATTTGPAPLAPSPAAALACGRPAAAGPSERPV